MEGLGSYAIPESTEAGTLELSDDPLSEPECGLEGSLAFSFLPCLTFFFAGLSFSSGSEPDAAFLFLLEEASLSLSCLPFFFSFLDALGGATISCGWSEEAAFIFLRVTRRPPLPSSSNMLSEVGRVDDVGTVEGSEGRGSDKATWTSGLSFLTRCSDLAGAAGTGVSAGGEGVSWVRERGVVVPVVDGVS